MPDNYTPQQIAAATGVSPQTVRRYLLENWRAHERGQWWRLSSAEYEFAVGQLRAAANVGTRQPRRELHRSNVLLPMF